MQNPSLKLKLNSTLIPILTLIILIVTSVFYNQIVISEDTGQQGIFSGDHISSNTRSNISTMDSDNTWPSFRGNLRNTGSTTGSKIPANNETLWEFHTNERIKSSPVVISDRVYFTTLNGTVFCLSQSNGTELWRQSIESVEHSSPFIIDSRLVVGTMDGLAFCLNSNNGTILWNNSLNTTIQSSPKVYNNIVIIGSYDTNLYALNLSSGQIIWSFPTAGYVHTTVAISDTLAYFGGCDGKLQAVYITNGSKAWDFDTGSYIITSPAIEQDKILLGTFDSQIFCLNSTNGEVFWQNSTEGNLKSSPAVHNNLALAVFASEAGEIFCYNISTGELIWSFKTQGNIYSSPAISDSRLVIGSYDQKIYCLNLSSGVQIWNFTTGGRVDSSPALAYDKIFIGSDDGVLYCFGNASSDYEPPSALVITPAPQAVVDSPDLRITGTASSKVEEIEYVEVRLDSGPWLRANGTTNWYIDLNLSNLNNGSHEISYHAYDGKEFSVEDYVDITLNIEQNNDKPDGNGTDGADEDGDDDWVSGTFMMVLVLGIIYVLLMLVIFAFGKKRLKR
jgi:outer membrane protein assembly factor BamB